MKMSNDFSLSWKSGQTKKCALIICLFSFVPLITPKDRDGVWSISEVIFDHAMTAYEQGEDVDAVRSFKTICRIVSGVSNTVGQQVC
jgi:hypothetical protein